MILISTGRNKIIMFVFGINNNNWMLEKNWMTKVKFTERFDYLKPETSYNLKLDWMVKVCLYRQNS